MSSASNPLLEAKGITKYFGTITALENVNLKVHAGECLGVVGDNGAGKSTLMKVLSGLYKPSAGSLFFQGKEEILESPRDSQNLGFKFFDIKCMSFKTMSPIAKKASVKAPALCAENKIFLTFLMGSLFLTGSSGNTSVAK